MTMSIESFCCTFFAEVAFWQNGVIGLGFVFQQFAFQFSSMAALKVFLLALGG
jgi:hypothetical protein